MATNKSDLITVLVPTYNRKNKVKKCIESILNQTYENLELIIIDDGSTDGTADYVKSLDDYRIKFIRFPENRGVNAAWNAGIEQATGFWIIMQGSDDQFLPDALERCFKYVREVPENVGIVRFNVTNSLTKEEMGWRSQDKKWVTEVVDYETYLTVKVGDHLMSFRPQIMDRGLKFYEWVNGFESLTFTQLMKDWDCLYVNEVLGVVDRDNSPDRLSLNRDIKQPGPSLRAYQLYLEVHSEVLQRHPNIRAKMTTRVALCNGYLGNRWEGLKWLFKAINYQPKCFFYPIKRVLFPILFGIRGDKLNRRVSHIINRIRRAVAK